MHKDETVGRFSAGRAARARPWSDCRGRSQGGARAKVVGDVIGSEKTAGRCRMQRATDVGGGDYGRHMGLGARGRE